MAKPLLVAPKVKVNVPGKRDYERLIEQTKMVYDQLLLRRCEQLIEEMYEQKEQFDQQVDSVANRDESRGLEVGVRAQELLHKLKLKNEAELAEQQLDYQQKLDKMVAEMEQQWRLKYNMA